MQNVFFYLLLSLIFLSQNCYSDDDLTIGEEEYYDEDEDFSTEPQEEAIPEEIVEPEYTPPASASGALLFENFQENVVGKTWKHSSSSDFGGRFTVGTCGDNVALSSEQGLCVPKEATRYAIYGPLSSSFDFEKETTFVVQYEVRLHDGLQCGGAYIKLASQQGSDFKPEDVTNDTPYTVMFGPDKCGGTNKVHFIWKFQNPATGEFEEHHLVDPPSPAGTSDKRSHIYTLVIRSDNSFEIFVDKSSVSKGNLLNDFEPPLNPPKEIDDSEDSKPEDWVDNAKMADPAAVKPEDWDEDAPRRIEDPEAEKPAGWNDDAPEQIADPDAKEPEDWDEEDDGEWESPIVDNPDCAVGCGEWNAPMIENPDYKGNWMAPMIDNPDYIGEWSPKQIDNPAFFEESTPFPKLTPVAGVVIDIWTMQKGIEFDNVYVGTSEDSAYELANSWKVRHDFQKSNMQGSSSSESGDNESNTAGDVKDWITENLVAVAATVGLLVLTFVYMCCCGSDVVEDNKEEAPAATTAATQNATPPENEAEEVAEKEEAKAEN